MSVEIDGSSVPSTETTGALRAVAASISRYVEMAEQRYPVIEIYRVHLLFDGIAKKEKVQSMIGEVSSFLKIEFSFTSRWAIDYNDGLSQTKFILESLNWSGCSRFSSVVPFLRFYRTVSSIWINRSLSVSPTSRRLTKRPRAKSLRWRDHSSWLFFEVRIWSRLWKKFPCAIKTVSDDLLRAFERNRCLAWFFGREILGHPAVPNSIWRRWEIGLAICWIIRRSVTFDLFHFDQLFVDRRRILSARHRSPKLKGQRWVASIDGSRNSSLTAIFKKIFLLSSGFSCNGSMKC